MKVITTVYDNDGACVRECSIRITDQPSTQYVCADVETAMLQLLHQWKFGHSLRLKGAEVQYIFKNSQ